MIELGLTVSVVLGLVVWLVRHFKEQVRELGRESDQWAWAIESKLRDDLDKIADTHKANMRRMREEFDAYMNDQQRYLILNGIASSKAIDEGVTEAPEEELSDPTWTSVTDPIKEFGKAVIAGDPVATDAVRDILKI